MPSRTEGPGRGRTLLPKGATEAAGAPRDDYIERPALASIIRSLAYWRAVLSTAEREQQGKLGLH